MKYYLVGIKGTGMSALAKILYDCGNVVRGVDYSKRQFTEEFMHKEIVIDTFENIVLDDEWFYIIGNAFKLSEVFKIIKNRNFKYAFYPIFIEDFFKIKKIGISGTHGHLHSR